MSTVGWPFEPLDYGINPNGGGEGPGPGTPS